MEDSCSTPITKTAGRDYRSITVFFSGVLMYLMVLKQHV